MFCCTLLYVHSSIAITLMGKRELVAVLNLSSWCHVMVDWPCGCLRLVNVVFPDHTHLLFKTRICNRRQRSKSMHLKSVLWSYSGCKPNRVS